MSTSQVNEKTPSSLLPDGLEAVFNIALKTAATQGDKPKEDPKQTYENTLNELAVSLGAGVDVDKRMLVGLTDSDQHKKLFKKLVELKLQEQAKDGKQPSLQEAISSAKDDLRNRSEHALRDDKDGGKKKDILEGYWDRQKGSDQAADLGAEAYRDSFNQNLPDTSNTNYDDNLNALASALVGGVDVDKRKLALAIGTDGPLAEVYKNLITEKLKEQGSPTNLDQAKKEVEEELFERMENAAGNSPGDKGDIMDVIKGYWDKHAGKDDADGLARDAYKEFQSQPTPPEQVSEITPIGNHEDTLNAIAAQMAKGINTENRTVTPFTDKTVRDAYASLVHDKLEEQKKKGDPINLDAAYDEAKKELFDRMPNALRDDPKAKEKMQILNNYWDKHDGKADAGGVAREAYAKFIAENTQTNNPSYEDNLNAITTILGGGTIDDTRTLSGLTDPTVKQLYENLITEKLKNGVDLGDDAKAEDGVAYLDKAIEQVNEDIKGRLGIALDGDAIKSEKMGIVENYFSKHGGEMDAKKAGEDAYAKYVEAGGKVGDSGLSPEDEAKKNLLAPSATDIMNAETAGGKSVNELYMEKLEALYKDEPEGSDKRKFLDLMKAQNSLGGGFAFLPYYYETKTDETIYADNPAALTGEEFQGLVDEEKLSAEIERLAGNEQIAGDTDKLLRESIGEIKDKQGLEDRIVATMTAPTYKQQLEEADAAKEGGALARYTSDLNSLAMLNPEKAQEVQQDLAMTTTVDGLNDIIEGGPGAIDDKTLDVAVSDVVHTTFKATMMAGYFGENAGNYMKAFDDYMDGKKLEELKTNDGKYLTKEEMQQLKDAKSAVDTMKTVVKDALKSTITTNLGEADKHTSWLKAIDQLNSSDLDKKIEAAMEKNKVAPEAKGKIGESLKGMAADGIFGTIGGVAALVAGTMTLTQAGGNDAATPEERMGAASSMLFAVSSSPQAVQAIGDPLAKLLGKKGVTEVLGLDKNGSDAWKGKLVPDTTTTIKNPTNASNLYRDINATIKNTSGTKVLEAFNKMSPSEQGAITRNIERMTKSMGAGFANLSFADKLKLIGPGLKLVANASYLGGAILGVYLGADSIAKLDSNSTDTEKTQAALSLVSGLAFTGSAAAGIAAWAGAGAAFGTASSALGGVGLVLAIVGLGIAQAVKYDKQKQAADEVRDYFTTLGKMGVMESDWGDKFNYLANVEYNYVSSEKPEITDEWYEYYFPEDMPAWEAQPEQYKEFTEKGGETTKLWWAFSEDGGELLKGHGEEPKGDKYVDHPPAGLSDYGR